MELSSRRQLSATVTAVKFEGLMAEITVMTSDGQELVPVITRTAADHLAIRVGDQVTVIITATAILLSK